MLNLHPFSLASGAEDEPFPIEGLLIFLIKSSKTDFYLSMKHVHLYPVQEQVALPLKITTPTPSPFTPADSA